MSLTTYKEHFDNAYQEVFQKSLVAKEVMNTRFEPTLTYGESVERVIYDIDNVVVRDTTRGSASTIDAISDSSELLTINLEKEAVFHISDGEVKQAGPLNPGQVIGSKIARKVALDLDGRCFAEVHNAAYDFDTGDLTTGVSTGVPFAITSTTAPQMVTRMAAKLRAKNNVEPLMNMTLVVDSYAAADIEQYLIGKDIDIAGSVFKNGYSGVVRNAVLRVSEQLPGEATYTFTDVNVATKTITINGVVFTSDATPADAGDVDVHATTEEGAVANYVAAINNSENLDPEEVGTLYCELSAADRATLTNAGIYAIDNGDATFTLRSRSGRMTVATDETNGDWSNNSLCAYYGKKGAIDLVVQDTKEVDMRPTADRRGTNVFTSYLAGIKTFTDGSKKFLRVLIAA
jgi:hypothetical protein